VENLLILKLEKKKFKLKFEIYRTINRGNSLMEKSKKWFKNIDRKISYLFIGFFLGVFNWLLYNWGAPITTYITSLWMILLYAFSWWIIGYFRKFRLIGLNRKEKLFLENLLKKKGLEFEIVNPIPIENHTYIIKRIYEDLEFYLDINRSKYPIEYYPKQKMFKIFYDGKMKSTVSKDLDVRNPLS
jgi:hypothetical protein